MAKKFSIRYNSNMTSEQHINTQNSPNEVLSLDNLRQDIDNIDVAILDLLSKRLDIVKKVGRYKELNPEKSSSMIRPGREAKMYRHLIARINSDYLPQALIKIWRGIISTALRAEQSMQIIAHTPNQNMNTYWLAQDYFGANLPISIKSDCRQILSDLQETKGLIAFFSQLDDSVKWWLDLSRFSEEKGFYIFVKLPLVDSVITTSQPFIKSPIAYAVTHVTPEDSGNDESLWVIESKESWITLAKLFADVHEAVQLIDQHNNHYLIALHRFCIAHKDPSIQDIEASPHILSLRCIGSYATDIIPSNNYKA